MTQMADYSFGDHWSFAFRDDPKRLAFVLSRYGFAARLACRDRSVLELGCSEGIGTHLLAKRAIQYTGVDLDLEAIESARIKFSDPKFSFIHDDFLGRNYGKFGAVISLDVVEHILPEFESIYFDTVANNTEEDGFCIIGTPNITAAAYASVTSNLGHVNLYSQERLVKVLGNYFDFVLPFGINDEMVHTGYAAMSHYLICLAFNKRSK